MSWRFLGGFSWGSLRRSSNSFSIPREAKARLIGRAHPKIKDLATLLGVGWLFRPERIVNHDFTRECKNAVFNSQLFQRAAWRLVCSGSACRNRPRLRLPWIQATAIPSCSEGSRYASAPRDGTTRHPDSLHVRLLKELSDVRRPARSLPQVRPTVSAWSISLRARSAGSALSLPMSQATSRKLRAAYPRSQCGSAISNRPPRRWCLPTTTSPAPRALCSRRLRPRSAKSPSRAPWWRRRSSISLNWSSPSDASKAGLARSLQRFRTWQRCRRRSRRSPNRQIFLR